MIERGLTALAVAALALAAMPAAAQDQAADFPSFDQVDGNLDGRITPAEFERAFPELDDPRQVFEEADSGGDGLVWREEWAAWRQQRVGAAGPAGGAGAAGGDGPAADDQWLDAGAQIEVAVTGEELQGRYLTDADMVGLPGSRLGFGLLFTDERDIVGGAELMAPGLLEGFLPGFVRVSLGGRAILGMLDDPDDDVFGLMPGVEARVRVPVTDTPMFVVGRLFFAPDILTFGDAEQIVDFDVRYEVQFLERTTGFVGYRVLNFEREDRGDDKIVNGLQVGLRFSF